MTGFVESEVELSSQELERLAARVTLGRARISIFVAMSPQAPRRVVGALLDSARERDIPVTLYTADLDGTFSFLSERHFADIELARIHVVVVAGSAPRRLAALADALPVSLWDAERMARTGEWVVDVYAVRASKAGDGDLDLGNMVGFTPAVLASETTVIAELTSASEFARDLFVATANDRTLLWVDPSTVVLDPRKPAPRESGSVQEVIAGHVASLIPDRSTVQLGMGALADALVFELAQKEGIGLHGGILPLAALEFIEQGRFAGGYKHVDRGLQVATGVAPDSGSARWPRSVQLRPINETHAPSRLAEHGNLWAINSALSVDVFGQVNAEWLAGVRVASGGGQADFMRAAHASASGAAIIALPSRSSRGHSRIVHALQNPGVVTTTGNDVDFVVTEWGVAHLTGRSAAARRAAIIDIAHPDDRWGLKDSGHEG